MSRRADWPPRPPSLPADAEFVELFGGGLRCWQPARGYRFSIDAVLLAMLAFDLPADDVLELGTGVGVVLSLLSRNHRFRRLVGLEVQPELARYARENLRLVPEARRATVVEGDLRAPPGEVGAGSFDLVVSNPPYFPVAHGHVNPNQQRAIARHEVLCDMDDVLRGARRALRDTGRAVLIYPTTRERDLIARAPAAGLRLLMVQPVRSRPGYDPRQVLFVLAPDGPHPPGRDTAPDYRPVLDLHGPTGEHVGRTADFFRRLADLTSAPAA